MAGEYYKIPLKLAEITKKKEQPKCSLSESVAEMLHLIATTCFGEFKHDESFGCEIWEHDFDNISNSQLYKDQLQKSIQQTIEKHEKRLSRIKVELQIEQVDYTLFRRRAKSRIKLSVSGVLSRTNENFVYNDQFFIGPLSYY